MEKVYMVSEKEMEELKKILEDVRHSINVIEQNKSNLDVIDMEINNIDSQAIKGIYMIP